jgi:hypothetical protein
MTAEYTLNSRGVGKGALVPAMIMVTCGHGATARTIERRININLGRNAGRIRRNGTNGRTEVGDGPQTELKQAMELLLGPVALKMPTPGMSRFDQV